MRICSCQLPVFYFLADKFMAWVSCNSRWQKPFLPLWLMQLSFMSFNGCCNRNIFPSSVMGHFLLLDPQISASQTLISRFLGICKELWSNKAVILDGNSVLYLEFRITSAFNQLSLALDALNLAECINFWQLNNFVGTFVSYKSDLL